jgi:hypothetical protein
MRRVFVTFAKDDAKIRDALIDAFISQANIIYGRTVTRGSSLAFGKSSRTCRATRNRRRGLS